MCACMHACCVHGVFLQFGAVCAYCVISFPHRQLPAPSTVLPREKPVGVLITAGYTSVLMLFLKTTLLDSKA